MNFDWENAKTETTSLIDATSDQNIDLFLDEEAVRAIVDAWPDWAEEEPVDYGGGVKTVSCRALFDLCDGSYYRLSSIFNIRRKDASKIMSELEGYLDEEVYR